MPLCESLCGSQGLCWAWVQGDAVVTPRADGDRDGHQFLGGLRQGAVLDRRSVQVAEALHLVGDRLHQVSIALAQFVA